MRSPCAAGLIVAVKGIGGFHLACDATSEDAVARLRVRKRRDEKPLAVMVRVAAAAAALVALDGEAPALLASVERPIVLAGGSARRAAWRRTLRPATGMIGVFLPYTPLHHLLLADAGPAAGHDVRQRVATSRSRSTTTMRWRGCGGIADLFLVARPRHRDARATTRWRR